MDPSPAPGSELPLRPRHELDAMAANIELTLISVVQGVALYFLTDTARAIFVERRLSCLPYLLTGLLIILAFWARAAIHAVTVIRWPLELTHNYLYITVTLFEAVLFTQAGSPRHWYPLGVLLIIVCELMFLYERRMYQLRRADSGGPRGLRLLDLLERDHLLSMRALMPLTLLLWSAAALAVWRWEALFLDTGWHVALGLAQAAGMLGYLLLVTGFFRGITGAILDARTEWGG